MERLTIVPKCPRNLVPTHGLPWPAPVYPWAIQLRCCPSCLQGLLNKRPADRLAWPDLLEHPFVRESPEDLRTREAALADAHVVAQESRGWKGEGGAIAGLQDTKEAAQFLPKIETALYRDCSSICCQACCVELRTQMTGASMLPNMVQAFVRQQLHAPAGAVLAAAVKVDTPGLDGRSPGLHTMPATGDPAALRRQQSTPASPTAGRQTVQQTPSTGLQPGPSQVKHRAAAQ